jgi:DNA-binding MarR family transcriptional regulator
VREPGLCLYVQRAARALARRFDEALRTVGLTNGQFSLLMAPNRPEPAAMGLVARLMAMDRITLTAALKPLERAGLVVAGADPSDRRDRLLGLTDKGRSVRAAAVPVRRDTQAAVEAGLPGLDADELRGALKALP